jgi:hypothetical protein
LATTAAVRIDKRAADVFENLLLKSEVESDVRHVEATLSEPEVGDHQERGGIPLIQLVEAHAVKSHDKPGIAYGGTQTLMREPSHQCAYTDVDWVPTQKDAEDVIKKMVGTDWTSFQSLSGGYLKPDHAKIKDGDDFIHLYIGNSAYSMNVERCSRGALALHDDGTAAQVFNDDKQRGLDVNDATALAVQFTAGLAAAIALYPVPMTPQVLYRGATEPPQEMIAALRYAHENGHDFMFPGLASLTLTKAHAKSFMPRGPYGGYWGRPSGGDQGDLVLYEFLTRQAKDITAINPGEAEWLLPPNRVFQVVSVSQKIDNYYYEVKLQDKDLA